jgi:hypothetical protein
MEYVPATSAGATSKYFPVELPAEAGVKKIIPPPGPVAPIVQLMDSSHVPFLLSRVILYISDEFDAGVSNEILNEEEEIVVTVSPVALPAGTNVLSDFIKTLAVATLVSKSGNAFDCELSYAEKTKTAP